MLQTYIGELSALITALFWTITAISFEFAGKRIGSLSVNLIRLVLGFLFLSIFAYFYRGSFFPTDANLHQWTWLSISGFVGFLVGDLLLFKSYTIIGARIAMLIMALSPPFAALIGWILLEETMSTKALFGMSITIAGIAWVVTQKETKNGNKKAQFKFSPKGLLYALGGSFGQAGGLVLSKYGMGTYDPFAATQIRIMTGLASFIFLFVVLKRWGKIYEALQHRKAMLGVSIGAFFGPFLGVSCSLLAIKYTSTGTASTIMSIVPVLIIPFSIFIFKENFRWKELFGAIITIAGVSLFFL